MRGVFVTGTGTEVGKTMVAAAIARALLTAGMRVAAFKPAVTGLSDTGRPDHEVLREAAASEQTDEEIAPYRFAPAVSPHLAAELAGARVEPQRLRAAAAAAAAGSDVTVCEGVGGLLVPLAPHYLIRDLAGDLGLPLVIAAIPGLGTINHTLLTLEAARSAGLRTGCVVLTPWPRNPDVVAHSNRDTLAAFGDVPVAVLGELDLASPDSWPPLDAPLAEFVDRLLAGDH